VQGDQPPGDRRGVGQPVRRRTGHPVRPEPVPGGEPAAPFDDIDAMHELMILQASDTVPALR
jgi:hypothetical protein